MDALKSQGIDERANEQERGVKHDRISEKEWTGASKDKATHSV